MQQLWKTLSVGVALLAICRSEVSAQTNASLSFYVVSNEKIEGGRFIDTNGFSKLGYIRTVPDLVITNLKEVRLTKTGGNSIMEGRDGKLTVTPIPEHPAVAITLHPDDAKKFETLTENSINKKLLVTLGDTPLIAPTVRDVIPMGNIELSLEETNQNKIADALKKLVTKNKTVQQ